MNIGDVFFRALIDDKALQTQAVSVGNKAGDVVGKSMGKGIGGALSGALKGGLAAVAGASTIALAGLGKLDSLQQKFQADTGATAAEARDAGKAINEMAGRNLQSMDDIESALAAVHTEMGLTGKAAEDLTEKFLKYSEATGQDATEAVKQFDDITDAWNLTAQDSVKIMDDLIASQHKYGGNLTDNQEALAKLAPALQALNLNWQDGIGLLNLFNATGIDAQAGIVAMKKAIQTLKPGQGIDDLIKQISSIQDPTKRAQAAMKLFGAKAGIQLAQAFQPGVTSLKQFEISEQDFTGSTMAAANAIESSFGNRAQLLIKSFGAALIGAGQSVGPLLTGLVSLSTIAGSLGFGKLGPKISGALAKSFRAVAASSIVQTAIGFVGDKAATVYLKALFAGDALSSTVAAAWNKLINSGPVQNALGAVGKVWGSTLGKATVLGFAAVMVVDMVNQLRSQTQEIQDQLNGIGQSIGEEIAAGNIEGLKQSKAAIETQIQELNKTNLLELLIGNPEKQAARKALQDQLDAITAALDADAAKNFDRVGETAGHALAQGVEKGVSNVHVTGGAGSFGGALANEFVKGMPAAGKKVIDAADRMVNTATAATNKQLAKRFREAGLRTAQSLAQGFQDGRDAVKQQWSSFLDILKNAESPMKERARLLGELTSKELQKGLHSQDPYVKATAETTKQTIIDRLATLKSDAKNIGKDGMEYLRKAMKSKDPDIRNAAKGIYNAALGKGAGYGPADVPGQMSKYGAAAVDNFAAGMRRSFPTLRGTAQDAGEIVSRFFKGLSPTKEGPLSKQGGMPGWGRKAGLNFADGLASAINSVRASSMALAAAAVPHPMQGAYAAPRAVLGAVGTAAAGATTTNYGDIHVHLHDIGNDVSPQRASKFGEQVAKAMASNFRVDGARIGIHPRRT